MPVFSPRMPSHPALQFVRAGQAFHLHLAPGDCVQTDSGAFRLVSRHWLAGQWLPMARHLEAGDSHRAEASGWVLLEAAPGGSSAFRLARSPRPWWQSWPSWFSPPSRGQSSQPTRGMP